MGSREERLQIIAMRDFGWNVCGLSASFETLLGYARLSLARQAEPPASR